METICPFQIAPAYAYLSSAGYVCVSPLVVAGSSSSSAQAALPSSCLTVAPQHLVVAFSAPVHTWRCLDKFDLHSITLCCDTHSKLKQHVVCYRGMCRSGGLGALRTAPRRRAMSLSAVFRIACFFWPALLLSVEDFGCPTV